MIHANNPYPVETLGPDDDDGTMVENVESLAESVIGRRIVSVEKGIDLPATDRHMYWARQTGTAITLDDGKRVFLVDTDDCCAYTDLESFLLHPERVDHIITGVGTTDGYTRWHIYADMGDVLELEVGWSSGNPFYYGYGFEILVQDAEVKS